MDMSKASEEEWDEYFFQQQKEHVSKFNAENEIEIEIVRSKLNGKVKLTPAQKKIFDFMKDAKPKSENDTWGSISFDDEGKIYFPVRNGWASIKTLRCLAAKDYIKLEAHSRFSFAYSITLLK